MKKAILFILLLAANLSAQSRSDTLAINKELLTYKHQQINATVVFATAFSARIIEAYRDSEIFEHPTENRSFAWHFAKIPQYGLIAAWGYYVLKPTIEKPTLINISVAGASLGIAWAGFEGSLWLFRKLR